MKYTYLLIILTFAGQLFSQNTFFKVYSTHLEELSHEVAQTTYGNFIITGKRSSGYYERDSKGLIMLIDENGQLIKEFTTENDTLSGFATIDKKPGQNDVYLITGFQDSISNANRIFSVVLYETDENIEILSRNTVFSLNNIMVRPSKSTFKNDSTILLLTRRMDETFTYPTPQFIVTEIRLPADSIRSYVSSIESINLPEDILYIPKNNETHVLYIGHHFDDTFTTKILKLDDMLNVITTMEPPAFMLTQACSTTLTDSTYLIAATTFPSSGLYTTRDIAVWRVDEDGNGINGTQYNNHQDTILYAGEGGSNTIILNDTIFVVGTHNVHPSAVPWQSSPSWIQVTKLDMELNILSHHFHGGDAFYMPCFVIPTLDNGMLITGYIYDYNSGEQQHDIFALKLNSNGMIVDVPENAPWQSTEAILYPNPASEMINIEFSQVYQKANFQLMDIGGKVVLETQLNSNYQSINISTLPAGTYVYRIFNKEGLDERGKIVVE